MITAIEHPSGVGLFIPRHTGWDRSHPEAHTEMVLAAIAATNVSFAHIVRLLKHWNRRNGTPLCSWNVKALALGCVWEPMTQLDGLAAWFQFAAEKLSVEETPDPARVADKPIGLRLPRQEVVRLLRDASKRLYEAMSLEAALYPVLAHDELAKLFRDEAMLARPDQTLVRLEEARRLQATASSDGVITGTTLATERPQIPVRSWAA